jgi:hypothetical protein
MKSAADQGGVKVPIASINELKKKGLSFGLNVRMHRAQKRNRRSGVQPSVDQRVMQIVS